MTRKPLYLLLLLFLPCWASAQTSVIFIEGKIFSKSTRETIPYAKVYNKTQRRAVLSDENGYFKIAIESYSDSLQIRVFDFKDYYLKPDPDITFHEVLLEESPQLLDEITVKPLDNSYLFDLLVDCRKSQSRATQSSRMYYELKSSVAGKQVELIENFYNGDIMGYDLEKLHLKTGRFALQQFGQTFFGSMESSKAITMFKLFGKNSYFPQSPFDLTEKKLKSGYYLKLHSKYLNDQQDSIYVVEFTPRDKSGTFFSGRAWIRKETKSILQVQLDCSNARIHPFKPIFPDDTIRNLDLHMTRSFENINGKMYFRHVDFSYELTYSNRSGQTYKASTQAVVYAYDKDSLFILPKFSFPNINDYKKINAIPYNAYFWNNHKELKMSDEKSKNDAFFNDPISTTNKTIFAKGKFEQGLLESPYLPWTGKRIRFREFAADTTESNILRPGINASQYNLSVKIFLDINMFSGALQFSTATLFDPYESYYKLPMDEKTLCFINVYFDLMEIERRELEKAIGNSDYKPETVERLYAESQKRVETLNAKYFREAEHGKNEEAMLKWNKLIFEKLYINNIRIFNPYEK